jgi:hypothetical protein
VPVLISGATGRFAEGINGLFAPTLERSLDGRVVYKKCDNSPLIIEHFCGEWAIKTEMSKGLYRIQGCVVGGCALEFCIGRVWRVFTGYHGWQSEETHLTIAIGADVERQVNANACALQHSRSPHFPSYFFQPHDALRFSQAADCTKKAALAVAEFNARAVPVLVSGAKEWLSESINGYYVPTLENTLDGCLIYSKCGDPSTCIARNVRTWDLRSIDKKGENDRPSARFDALDSSGFLQTGHPLVLGGALWMLIPAWTNLCHPIEEVTVSIGVEVNRQVRVAASAT